MKVWRTSVTKFCKLLIDMPRNFCSFCFFQTLSSKHFRCMSFEIDRIYLFCKIHKDIAYWWAFCERELKNTIPNALLLCLAVKNCFAALYYLYFRCWAKLYSYQFIMCSTLLVIYFVSKERNQLSSFFKEI